MIIADTPIGRLAITGHNGILSQIRMAKSEEMDAGVEPVEQEAVRQIKAYFDGRLQRLSLPYELEGSVFERKVWEELAEVPYGCVVSYGELANRCCMPGAARAAGRACGRNPMLILIPCHRVVGTDGRLTGFAAGMEAKAALLEHEGHKVLQNRIIK